jgi:hypothetical protein
MATSFLPDGCRLMNHALLYSVLGFIPLAVLATGLLHRVARQKPDAA